MKKLYPLGLLVVPLFLAAAWMGARTIEGTPQQEFEWFPGYSLESGHFAMDDLGNLLERMGREIQQDQQITIGGMSYSVSGFGGIEFGVNRFARGGPMRTGVELSFGADGRTTTPVNRRTGQPRAEYDPYERGGRAWEPSALADLLDEFAETLANTGMIEMEYHHFPFKGAAKIDQRLLKKATGRGPLRYSNELEVHVLFGEGDPEWPDDDEDYVEDQEYGLIESLARSQEEGADRAAVAQLFAAVAENLRAERVQVGDEDLSVGTAPVSFGLTHVTASDGSYDKIEFTLEFGLEEWPPSAISGDQDAPRYYDEQWNEPLADLAAVLQRLAAQILEDGTFELGGETFPASRVASWDIGASGGGFSVEVSYQEPPE